MLGIKARWMLENEVPHSDTNPSSAPVEWKVVEKTPTSREKVLAMPIEEMAFGTHVNFALKRANITNVGGLLDYSADEYRKHLRFSGKKIDEIRHKLQMMGLDIKEELEMV